MSEPAREPADQPSDDSPATATADEDLLAVLADEFAARLRRGEQPQVEEYAERHPAIAVRIRKMLEALALMEQSRTIDYSSAAERVGAMVGRYKLLERIGEGGFGVVYMAEQQHPVRRKVAIKVVKPGMDSHQVLARFEAERQALAIMDHPNIAKVFDAGATDSGRPYFVMELIKGEPITEFCDRNQFTPQQRLELFAQVCQAVQHAHQKGIIHRDIKPTNVLVGMHDTTPVVKVIDFGVAKALGQELTDKTLFTGFAQFLGTPLYMSPEQAGQSVLDVDTRSDVYSLGVLLYELLTGTTPFDKDRFKQAAKDEIFRIIREEEPPTPSTRLISLSLGERAGVRVSSSLATISAQRQMEPARLTKLVRGELDWIVMKCLEKDRNRRFETASGLAADIERYLNDEQVLACPPSAVYRFRKFAWRNRVALTTAVLVSGTLVLGTILSTWQAIRATAEKQRADEQAAIAKAVSDFMSEMLSAADPKRVLGDKVTVVEAIGEAIKKLDTGAFKDQPLTEAAVRKTIGMTLSGLGRYREAEENLRKALDLRRSVLPAGHQDIAQSLHDLGSLHFLQGRYNDAELLLREAIDLRRKALTQPGQRSRTEEVNLSYDLTSLALVLRVKRRWGEAESLAREALEIRRRSLSASDQHIAHALGGLAGVMLRQGRTSEAEALRREALDITRKMLPTGHPDLNAQLAGLADVLRRQGKLNEAEPLLREALEGSRGTEYPERTRIMRSMAILLKTQGRLEEAEPFYREALELDFKVLPAGNFGFAERLAIQGKMLKTLGKFKEANELWDRIGQTYLQDLSNRRKAEGDTAALASSLTWVGSFLQSAGRFDDAEVQYRDVLAIRRKPLGEESKIVWTCLRLAGMLQSQGRNADVQKLWRETVEFATRAVELAPQEGSNWKTLGVAQYYTGAWQPATESLEKSMNLRNGGDEFDWFFLAMAHWQLGHKDEARTWYEKAVSWMDKNQPMNEKLLGFRNQAAELLGIEIRQ